ncbi:MAG: hypothetical protein IPM34_07585 [Saprospiraceae bacterium]|nr:hypothetical protein [Saprospiraceae bacterium]
MKLVMRTMTLFLTLLISYSFCSAQPIISDMHVANDIGSNKFEIVYNLHPFEDSKYFKIDVCTYIHGKEFNLKDINGKLSGDYGEFLNVGNSKKIIWTVNETIVSSNAVFFKLDAIPYSKFSSSKYYLKSMLVPGWGSGQLMNGKMDKLMAIGSYLILAAGVGLYQKAKSDYNSYLLKDNAKESDQQYSKVTKELNLANYFFAGFGALWLTDLIRLTVGINKRKKTYEIGEDGYYYLSEKQEKVSTAGFKIWLK